MARKSLFNRRIAKGLTAENAEDRIKAWNELIDRNQEEIQKTSVALNDLIRVLHDLTHTVGSVSGRWIMSGAFAWTCTECGVILKPVAPELYELSIVKALGDLGNSAAKAEYETLRGQGPFVPVTQA